MNIYSKDCQLDIKKARESIKMSQRELSELSDVSQSVICNIESGKIEASEKIAEKLKKVFEMSPQEIKEKISENNKETGYYDRHIKAIFASYEEKITTDYVKFKGTLHDKRGKSPTDKIIKIIDGGRLNKGYSVEHRGNSISGTIFNFSDTEIRKMSQKKLREYASEQGVKIEHARLY